MGFLAPIIAHPFISAGVAAAVGQGVSQIKQTQAAVKETKNATAEAAAQNAAAQTAVKNAQASASSQASAVIAEKQRRIRSSSQSIYTSPLGIGGMATVAKKYLLGQ